MGYATGTINTGKTKENIKYKFTKEDLAGVLFASPVLLGMLIFVIGPIIATAVLGFTNYNAINTPEFIGFDNYKNLFFSSDKSFIDSIRATFYYVMVSVPLGIVFSLAVAILLNSNINGRAFFRGAFYLPVVIPLAASSVLWMWLFQPQFGLVNFVLRTLGLPTSEWLASDASVIPTFIIISLWLCGNTIVIFLAGLQEVPSQLYEAIDVDGGNAFHKLIYITIPMISPIIFFNTVIGFINGFQTFVQPAIMTSDSYHYGGPDNASLLYVLFIYREGFKFSKLGSASAAAIMLFMVILIFTAVFFGFQKSFVYYEGEVKKK